MEPIRTSNGREIQVLDLNFLGGEHRIASYMIRHGDGVALIETGPGTVTGGIGRALAEHGLRPEDVTEVLVSHIHLDHAGASGWFAQKGAHIYVHANGAPHLMDPGNLMASAGRIYGDDMDRLWGEFIPVPEESITVLEDDQELVLGGVPIRVMDTPGHAEHHFAYWVDDVCFTGDVGGVRMPGSDVVVPPMPPPEFLPERWRASLERIEAARPSVLCPTHFGPYRDIDHHLNALREGLDAAEEWAERVMPEDPPVEELKARYTDWLRERVMAEGLSEADWENHEAINPSWMSALGLRRYWRKYRAGG